MFVVVHTVVVYVSALSAVLERLSAFKTKEGCLREAAGHHSFSEVQLIIKFLNM